MKLRVVTALLVLGLTTLLTPCSLDGGDRQVIVVERDFEVSCVSNKEIVTEIEEIKRVEGFATACVNLREFPDTNSESIGLISYGTELRGTVSGEWLNVGNGYVCLDYIADTVVFEDKEVPDNYNFKSYMSYKCLLGSSKQGILQKSAYTGEYGIRQVDNRFCVALASYYTTDIGQYFDLILDNGVVIPCILSDGKADCHTDDNNMYTISNGCVSEFIVDTENLNSVAKRTGNLSNISEEWNSPVVRIRVYNKNYFGDN